MNSSERLLYAMISTIEELNEVPAGKPCWWLLEAANKPRVLGYIPAALPTCGIIVRIK